MDRFALVKPILWAGRRGYSIFEIRKITQKSAMGMFWTQEDGEWHHSDDVRVRLLDIVKTCQTRNVAAALLANLDDIRKERELTIKEADEKYQLRLNRLLNK